MNRNERRRQRASVLGRFASHPTAKRLLENYQRYGREAAEIYIQNDDGSGIPRYFDVFSAKLWCAKYRRIEALEIDQKLVKELSSNGAVDFEHLKSKKFDEDVAPIIFLLEATIAGGLLLDGAHRYVAFAEKVQELEMAEFTRKVPAYVLEPKDWKKFVVPPLVAEAFQFSNQSRSVLTQGDGN